MILPSGYGKGEGLSYAGCRRSWICPAGRLLDGLDKPLSLWVVILERSTWPEARKELTPANTHTSVELGLPGLSIQERPQTIQHPYVDLGKEPYTEAPA